ncbi:MAG TPA: PDZ domain-containing protein, partial [Thermoanaerobaculia bacterium]|nr:PDZ domain-containing protein [Thermoanaerobaculia bacterium]
DGKEILFLAHRAPWSERIGRPYLVPVAGGMERPLPMPHSGTGMFSPDGKRLVYTPVEREFRTWKRYRGGWAQDVWIYDLAANRAEQITTDPATDNQPMWLGDLIVFNSDREDGKLNLWSYDLRTKQSRKVTTHTDYDVLWPSSDGTQVVYENGGYIWRFDPRSGRSERVPIRVQGDFKNTLPRFQNVKSNIDWYTISPTGARALFGARGEVFTAPAKYGEVRNLSQTPGVREMDPVWSPDGKWIAYLSDRDGRGYEIYLRPADGGGDERQLTRGGTAWKFPLYWSPDSRMLAYGDKDRTLNLVDVASGNVTVVDRDEYGDITHYRWSPDSRWVAYTKLDQAQFGSIYVHSVPEKKSYRLTSGMTDDLEPVFDPKGRYLYFRSARDFNLTFSAWEFNYVYTDPTRIYVGILAADGPPLLLPQSDEEKAAAPDAPAAAAAPEKPAEKKAAEKVVVRIDPAGFEQRVRAIPGSAGNYASLDTLANGVLYLHGPSGKQSLKFYNIEDRKEETIIEAVRGYELSADREKMIVRSANEFAIISAKPGQKIADNAIVLDRMEMKIDPRAEWAQQFTDAWRILRDWFYDPNMHGLDWEAMRQKYGQLVPHVAHRADLDYILGELGGELNAGHVYVESPSSGTVTRVDNGLLGADVAADPSGYYRITKIYPGENWDDRFRSPLTEAGVKVKTGDYILAVDGSSTKGVDNFYKLLENKANRVVTLLVNSRPDTTGAREERVRPITQETNVRYLDWVQSRREMVDRLSGGRIGYIHLPNTAREGNEQLFRAFYPLASKQALIIDDRYNGGGFIPDRMIELLDRDVLNYIVRRNAKPTSTPAYAHVGPKAMLINGYSASGGDALPYYFRKRGLGPLIGTRTWGGLIGISGNPTLMDGGRITAPQFRFLDTEGMWMVEGVGVPPDIEVVDRPDEVAAGRDPSLEKAVEVLLEELRKNPVKPVVVPKPPTGI